MNKVMNRPGKMELGVEAVIAGVTDGWAKYVSSDDNNTSHCLGRWIYMVEGNQDELYGFMENVLDEYFPYRIWIVSFNDAHNTTKQDVLNFLDYALDAAKEYDEGWRW